jgi:hypothetical protein
MNNPGQSGLPSVEYAFLHGVMMPVVYEVYLPFDMAQFSNSSWQAPE